MRNRAAPDIMRRYASSAFSNGRVSIMGRTSVSTLKSRVSWVSIALPVRLPMTDRPPKISGTPLTGIGSPDTPTTTSFPRTERPGSRLAIAVPLGRGRQDHVGASQFLQRSSRILSFGVDVNVKLPVWAQDVLCLDRSRLQRCENPSSWRTARQCPNPPMPWTSNGIACTSSVAERIECGDAGADQRAASSDLSSSGMRTSARASAIIISA